MRLAIRVRKPFGIRSPRGSHQQLKLHGGGVLCNGSSIPAITDCRITGNLAELGGGIVFVGTSAQGLKDQRATPLHPAAPGVDVHAQIFMMDERAFNKEFNAYYEAARKQHGVKYTRARISFIAEDTARYSEDSGCVLD